MRWLLLKLIDAYAVTFGPHLGGRCRFEPSCSHYAKEAITAHGSLKGSWLAVRRIARCGPWTKGGMDPVPETCRGGFHEDKNTGRHFPRPRPKSCHSE